MAPFLDTDSASGGTTRSPTPTSDSSSDCWGLEDIAVIGLGCRLPGEVRSTTELWQSLLDRKVASGDLPDIRYEAYHRRDPRNSKILKEMTQRGYFINDIADFDATFFGVSPKEAELMDIQQRLALEVTWEALEDAGIPPPSLAGSNTGCFFGINSDDYGKLLLEDLPGVEAWMGIGTAYCGVPNRISYLLDLRGPSTAMDAACASSLVSVHHGRQSLLAGETDLMIVGGVQAICSPGLTRVLDRAGAISKDGICRSFDNAANGYGRGEGAAVAILKRLTDAIRDKDRIHGVIKGSAVGQDGKTNGIMAPSGLAQQAVARKALGSIDPRSIQYVEAHATSTVVGDPVEVDAISKVYGQDRKNNPCYIGSVKANVGHLEAGAGIVGFIKAILAVKEKTIPPQANFEVPNRNIDWLNSGLLVSPEALNWPFTPGPRRAAVCSYGYGGSVSHAVIEAFLDAGPRTADQESNYPTVILLSAVQEKRNETFAATLSNWIARESAIPLSSTAFTLAAKRAHHTFRSGFVAESREQACRVLNDMAKSSAPSVQRSRAFDESERRLVWLFSGHGAQWDQMGQELIRREPVFRHAVERIDGIFKENAGFSAVEALYSGQFIGSDKVQILTYAMQVGLTALLKAKGVKPDAIIGHSVGEVAAAAAAGAITVDEGASIVSKRSVLYRQVMGTGAMALVNATPTEAATMLLGKTDIWVAIESSISSCVVAGSVAAIQDFKAECNSKGVKVTSVKTDIAFHTPLLNPLAPQLFEILSEIIPQEPDVCLYSTAMHDPRSESLRDALYWVENTLKPVRLSSAVQAAVQDGYRIFMEISSHPIISQSVTETIMNMEEVHDFVVAPTLLRNKPSRAALLKSLVNIWTRGAAVDWSRFFSGIKWSEKVPKTQWLHKTYWKKVGSAASGSLTHDVDHHTLLGQRIDVASTDQIVFTTKLSQETKPFPGSHPLHGTEIVPAAVLLHTFVTAVGRGSVSDVHLRVPVAISAPRDVQVVMASTNIRLMSRLLENEQAEADAKGSWLTHTTASLPRKCTVEGILKNIDISSIKARATATLDPNFSVNYLSRVGVPLMGFPWKVTEHTSNQGEMLARVDVCPDAKGGVLPWDTGSWAPIFDAATSIGSTIFKEPRLRMPAHVANVSIREDVKPPKVGFIHVQLSDGLDLATDVTITDECGEAVAKITGMRFSEIEGTPGMTISTEGLIHRPSWVPAKLRDTALLLSSAVIVSTSKGLRAKKLEKQLRARSIPTTLLSAHEISELLLQDANTEGLVILYMPEIDEGIGVAEQSGTFCHQLLAVIQHIVSTPNSARVYALTSGALDGPSSATLAYASLVGLSRIIASEHSGNWGALIDTEEDLDMFPLQPLKYISDTDVVKVDEDGVARVSRLRPLPKVKSMFSGGFTPKSNGTYLITGGLGSLGLEVAAYLVEHGARRIVLVSRRTLPPREEWSAQNTMATTLNKILALEEIGASVHCIAMDIAAADAPVTLRQQLDRLRLPAVRGVVHAAGVLEDQLVARATESSFCRVLAPKVSGALAIHAAFPPRTLDFLVLFSSCGQLLGFPGQAAYASGNSFLDTLAEHRRRQQDNTVSIQWTSWSGIGGMGGSDFVAAELHNRGITAVEKGEAFRAWEAIASRDSAVATVLRTRLLDADEPLPHPILADIAVRRERGSSNSSANANGEKATRDVSKSFPESGPDRLDAIKMAISNAVVTVLGLSNAEEVDSRAALADLGMDSVMTVTLRREMQKALGVVVPPTLIWGHPTVEHLVKWADGKCT